MVKNIRKKNAIAMVELIFALVIMGIVLMSAPMLIQQSIKSSNVALQQEAIVAAASQTAIILSMHWDENNTQGGSSILNAPGFANYPPDGLSGIQGRNANTIAPVFMPSVGLGPDLILGGGADFNETVYTKFDDVDDYDGSSLGLILYHTAAGTADVGEYVDTQIEINTTIRYVREDNVSNAAGGSSNVKAINVNLTSTANVEELDKNITFNAFSCNIGTYNINGAEL